MCRNYYDIVLPKLTHKVITIIFNVRKLFQIYYRLLKTKMNGVRVQGQIPWLLLLF